LLIKARHIILGFIDFFHRPFSAWIDQQTFRYLACGGSNTVLGLVIYYIGLHYILHEHSVILGNLIIHPYIAAYIISFVINFPLGFVLSKYIVFQESNLHGRVQFFRYVLLIATCILLNYTFIRIFVELCHFYPTPSSALAAIIVAIFSYLAQRKFTFKVKEVVQ
jgi:putative flippase GtrA